MRSTGRTWTTVLGSTTGGKHARLFSDKVAKLVYVRANQTSRTASSTRPRIRGQWARTGVERRHYPTGVGKREGYGA